MIVMVTGGRGYVGSYVVDELIRRGHTVVSYNRDLPRPSGREIQVLGELYDIPRMLDTIRKYGIERIIHTAAQSHPDVSLEVPLATVEANVMGTTEVYECARLSGIKRVVAYSSECAYGHTPPGIVKESTPLRPRTPYGVTKAASEMMAMAYNECFGMDIIALRVSQIYGPGQIMQEYVRDAIKAAIRGEHYTLPRGRDQKFQLVHVTDVARASVSACFVGDHSSHVYNVTGGVQPTFGEVLDMLREMIPGASFEVGSGDLNYDDQGLFDLEAARRDLGYEPQVSLEEGLREYVRWLRTSEF